MARGRATEDMDTTIPRKNWNGVRSGYEADLWDTTNALRNTTDAAEFKHVVLPPKIQYAP